LNLFNRKELKPLRSSLRKRSTSAEATLWEMLKSKKLDGKKFRRQYSIGYYIADFCCPSEKIIIELDGDYQRIEKDEQINHPVPTLRSGHPSFKRRGKFFSHFCTILY